MNAWYAKPVAQISVQPMDGLKLTAQGSFGEFGKISTRKSKDKDAKNLSVHSTVWASTKATV